MAALSTELYYTALVAGFTGVTWIPLILNRLTEIGLWKALKNPEPDSRPEAAWAFRLSHAHRNALENLAVFAPLAIIVHIIGSGNEVTAFAAAAFLYTRIAHTVIYTFGVPLLRTIAFFTGFICQILLLLNIVGIL